MVKLIPSELREHDFSAADFLSAGQQEAYERACEQFSGKARDNLKVGREGSNLFKVLLLNQTGIRTATLPELELALENGLDLRGTYEDGREVVLRNKKDSYGPNNLLIRVLSKELDLGKIRKPLIITGLRVNENLDSEYGLVLMPSDETKVVEAPDFADANDGRKFRRINPNYSIDFDERGKRILYTRHGGLSGLFLVRDLVLYSNNGGLSDSNDSGRVVVVSGEADEKRLALYLDILRQQREELDRQTDERFTRAQAILRGE